MTTENTDYTENFRVPFRDCLIYNLGIHGIHGIHGKFVGLCFRIASYITTENTENL